MKSLQLTIRFSPTEKQYLDEQFSNVNKSALVRKFLLGDAEEVDQRRKSVKRL